MTNINITVLPEPIEKACPTSCNPQNDEQPCPTGMLPCIFGYTKQYGIQTEYEGIISDKYIAVRDAQQICFPGLRADTRSCLIEYLNNHNPILVRDMCGYISSITTSATETIVLVMDTGGVSQSVTINASSDSAFIEKFGSEFWTVEIRDIRPKKISAVALSLAIVGSVAIFIALCSVAVWTIMRALGKR